MTKTYLQLRQTSLTQGLVYSENPETVFSLKECRWFSGCYPMPVIKSLPLSHCLSAQTLSSRVFCDAGVGNLSALQLPLCLCWPVGSTKGSCKDEGGRGTCFILFARCWLPVPISINLASSHLFPLEALVCFSKMLHWVCSFSTLSTPALVCACRNSSTFWCCSVSLFRVLGPSPVTFLLQAKRYQFRSSSGSFSEVWVSTLQGAYSKFIHLHSFPKP